MGRDVALSASDLPGVPCSTRCTSDRWTCRCGMPPCAQPRSPATWSCVPSTSSRSSRSWPPVRRATRQQLRSCAPRNPDRIATVAAELRKMGAAIDELPDGMIVHGPTWPGAPGVLVEVPGRRLAMALAVVGSWPRARRDRQEGGGDRRLIPGCRDDGGAGQQHRVGRCEPLRCRFRPDRDKQPG